MSYNGSMNTNNVSRIGVDMTNYEESGVILTTGGVACLLEVHPSTVRRWSNREVIKSYRIGSRCDRRFRQEDISRLLAEFNASRGNEMKAGVIRR